MLRNVKELADGSVSARVARIPCLESVLKVCAAVLVVQIVGTDSAGRVLVACVRDSQILVRSQGEVLHCRARALDDHLITCG